MCTLRGDGSLECKNVFLRPCRKGLRVRNPAARELKLPPFLGIGVQQGGCSRRGGGGHSSSCLVSGRGRTGNWECVWQRLTLPGRDAEV